MQIPTPATWAPGFWSAGDANKYIRDHANFFLNVPMCILRKDNREQIVGGLATARFEFDTVVYDNDGMFEESNNGYLVPQTPGIYMINWQVQWQLISGSVDVHRRHQVWKFDSTDTLIAISDLRHGNYTLLDGGESHTGSTVFPLDVGDYLEFRVECFGDVNGSHRLCNLDVAAGRYGCQMEARWISKL